MHDRPLNACYEAVLAQVNHCRAVTAQRGSGDFLACDQHLMNSL
jgi:hypothetical protein